MDASSNAQTSFFLVLACTSWGLVEVPRYLFYALNLLNAVPYPLFWLRYR
jgi:very-long-chain (3R)-3-hydroxyacyl-CoA dehydratase